MKIYWTTNSIPELTNLPRVERQRTWWKCYWKFLRQWPGCLTLLIVPTCGVVGCAVGDWLAPHKVSVSWTNEGAQFIRSDRTLFYVCAAVGGGIGGAIFGQTANHHIRPHLRDYLECTNAASEKVA